MEYSRFPQELGKPNIFWGRLRLEDYEEDSFTANAGRRSTWRLCLSRHRDRGSCPAPRHVHVYYCICIVAAITEAVNEALVAVVVDYFTGRVLVLSAVCVA